MTDLLDLIVNILVPALSLTIPALITAGLTYFIVNRYERQKDKIEIKKKLIKMAVKYDHLHEKAINIIHRYEKDNNNDSFELLGTLAEDMDIIATKIIALISIYSKNIEHNKEIRDILDKIAKNFNNLLEKLISGYEFKYNNYEENLNNLSKNMVIIYTFIRKIKIDYIV